MATSDRSGSIQDEHDPLNRISDPIIALDEDHRYTYVNEKAARTLEVDPESVLGESIEDTFPRGWDARIRGAIARAREIGQTVSFERYNPEVEHRLECKVDSDETGTTVRFIDTTEQEERETDLNRAETLFQNAQDGLFIVDVEDGGETFRLNRVNQSYEDLTETSSDELRGKTIGELTTEAESKVVREQYRECVNERTELAYEEQVSVFGDDAWWETRIAPVITDDAVTQLVGSTRKITEQKQRENRLRKFERMVNQTGHAVFFTNVDGEIQYVNPAFERMTGYTGAEVIGQTPNVLNSGAHPDAHFADLWETVLDGEVWNGEIVNERKDGTSFVANHTIAPVMDESGDVMNFVAIYDDITERKEREERLQTHELVVQAMDEVAFLVDDERRIQFANKAALDFADVPLEELVGLPIEPITEEMAAPDEDPTRFVQAIDSVLLDEDPSVGTWVRDPDGTETLSLEFDLWLESVGWVCAEQRFVPVELYDGTTGVAIISRDITERKKKEEEIQEHLVQAQDLGNVGSWHLDMEDEDLYWSDECHRIFDIPRDESMTYERFLNAVHPGDREAVDEAWNAALEGGTYDIEHRILADDRIKWVHETAEVKFDEDGEPTKGVGVVRDITNQVEREREISEQKRRYEALFNSIRDPIVVTDTDDRITNCNPGFTDLFGYELDEIKGNSIGTLLADDEDVTESSMLGQGLVDDMARRTTGEYQKRSGQEFPGETSLSQFTDAEKNVAGFVYQIRDVSDRERNRQQMKVIDRVLRHNIKNDMTAIIGHAEIIQANAPSEIESSIKKILEVSQKFVETAEKQRKITGVLTEPPEMATFDIVPFVESAVTEVREQHPAADVRVTLPESLRVNAIHHIGEAVRELLRNAVAHSDEARPVVEVKVRNEDGNAAVSIRDDGPGIPEMESNILTRQAEIDPLYHGSGLGLWLVHEIVRRSDGRLCFEETSSDGSSVTISLPAE
jgi:PAS domain S-box-containing protein